MGEFIKVQEQFNRVLQYSQGLNHVNTDQIFKDWKANKAKFIDAMGSMIYELDTPVTFELDADSKKEKIDEFIRWVDEQYGYQMVEFFVENYDAILENKLLKPWHNFPTGMKLSKVLMKEFGLGAEDVRQKLAMLIQSNKVSGKLCLSVHPLDFLSASENNHGWRSCHALDGEYRAGNVSYMVDNCTIMAYLKSEHDAKLPNFPDDVPWNDKKWRCYFYCDKENRLIYAARQYPFHTDVGLQMVAQMLNKFNYFDNDYLHEWNQMVDRHYYYLPGADVYKKDQVPMVSFKHRGIRGETTINGERYFFDSTKVIVGRDGSADLRIVPMKKFIDTHPDACCFNDVINSHTYSPWIMSYDYEAPDMPTEVNHKLIIGGRCNCVTCGEYTFADSDRFQCEGCSNGNTEDYYDAEEEHDAEDRPDTGSSFFWNWN